MADAVATTAGAVLGKKPTTINAGAVANDGMARKIGERNSASTNITAVEIAVRPVRPPSATPAVDSTLGHSQGLYRQAEGRSPGYVGILRAVCPENHHLDYGLIDNKEKTGAGVPAPVFLCTLLSIFSILSFQRGFQRL